MNFNLKFPSKWIQLNMEEEEFKKEDYMELLHELKLIQDWKKVDENENKISWREELICLFHKETANLHFVHYQSENHHFCLHYFESDYFEGLGFCFPQKIWEYYFGNDVFLTPETSDTFKFVCSYWNEKQFNTRFCVGFNESMTFNHSIFFHTCQQTRFKIIKEKQSCHNITSFISFAQQVVNEIL